MKCFLFLHYKCKTIPHLCVPSVFLTAFFSSPSCNSFQLCNVLYWSYYVISTSNGIKLLRDIYPFPWFSGRTGVLRLSEGFIGRALNDIVLIKRVDFPLLTPCYSFYFSWNNFPELRTAFYSLNRYFIQVLTPEVGEIFIRGLWTARKKSNY